MAVERFIDYLQTSLWLSESQVIMRGFEPVSPVRFYKRGYKHPNGFRLYFGNPNSKKAMAIASGETMQSLRNDQKLDAEVIDWVLSAGGEISRLDLAVTEYIDDELVVLEDVEKWFVSQLIESSLINGGLKQIASVSTLAGTTRETLYIGDVSRRGKQGIFRAYDKGIEMGIGSEIVTRIELELKRDKAHNVAKRLAQSNDIAGNFRTHFNVRSQDFERLMDADIVPAVRGKNLAKEQESEEAKRRWDWLIEQVAPALRKAIAVERKEGRGDYQLSKFLIESGLQHEMLDAARVYALHAEYDKLVQKRTISSLDLD